MQRMFGINLTSRKDSPKGAAGTTKLPTAQDQALTSRALMWYSKFLG